MAMPHEDDMFELAAKELRTQLGEIELKARALRDAAARRAIDAPHSPQRELASETIAQAMLAVRHVEDARMRIGKVLQYGLQGGVPWGGKEPA